MKALDSDGTRVAKVAAMAHVLGRGCCMGKPTHHSRWDEQVDDPFE